jgi:hypothetical protein
VGNTEAHRPLGRSRQRWEVNIKIDLREIRGGAVDWLDLALDKVQWRPLVNTVMNLWVEKFFRS